MQIWHMMQSLRSGEGGIAAAVGMMVTQVRAGLTVTAVTDEPPPPGPLQGHRKTLAAAGVALVPSDRLPPQPAPRQHALHVHGLWDQILLKALRWAQRNDVPVILSPHGMLTPWALKQSWAKKTVYRQLFLNPAMPRGANNLTLHYCTQWEQQHSAGFWKNHGDESHAVIPLSLDLNSLRQELDEQRLQPGVGPTVHDKLEAGPVFLGRVHPGKGVEYLVPAIKHLPKHIGPITIIGHWDQSFGHELRRKAQAAGVEDRLIWKGAIYPPKVYAHLAAASALLLPSDHENFGLVAIEAIACGTPALLSREVAVGTALVEAGVAGWIDRDPQTLGRQLAEWYAPTDAARQRLAAMRERCADAAQAFDHASVGPQWRELYTSVAQPDATAKPR